MCVYAWAHLLRCELQCKQARLLERRLWTALLQWLAIYAHPCGCVAMVDRLAMYATVESVCCVRGLASGATCTYAVRTRGSECVAVGGEARTRCAVWLFAVGSLRDFPESLAEGIYIPLCASGPQLRQFGGVCLIYEHSHHAFIHTLLHNVPDKRNEYSSPGGRRPQRAECSLHTRSLATAANVGSCPTTVETCSCRFILLSFRETRACESLSLFLKPSARETICCFVPMVAFLLPPSLLEGKGMICGVHGRGPC